MVFYCVMALIPKGITRSSATILKSSRHKKDLNEAHGTADPFSVSFSQLPAAKKNTEKGAAVTSLRSFLFCDNFTILYEFVQKPQTSLIALSNAYLMTKYM